MYVNKEEDAEIKLIDFGLAAQVWESEVGGSGKWQVGGSRLVSKVEGQSVWEARWRRMRNDGRWEVRSQYIGCRHGRVDD